MRSIKKLMGLLVITISIVCSGCGNVANQKLTPVEASDKQVSTTGLSVEIPKGWSEQEGIMEDSSLVMAKGDSTIRVFKEDAPGLVDQDIDTIFANVKTIYEATTSGVKLVGSEIKTLEVGDAVVFKLETTVTKELIDENINSGIYTEEATKNAETLIGKTNHQIIIHTLVTVDGITYTEDAAGIEEVATFIANSVTLS